MRNLCFLALLLAWCVPLGNVRGDEQNSADAKAKPVKAIKLQVAASENAETDDAETANDGDAESKPAKRATPQRLSIGSIAPPLDIEHWVNTARPAVTDFEPGKVYVVEFWATWCGPCLASMPHLAELQTKYADQNVRIISVSREDIDTVTEFLDRPVNPAFLKGREPVKDESDDESDDVGAADKEVTPLTYGDLTSVYSLTTDPDATTSDDYMKAANQNGIPCAFIVGMDGHVEWIGHPMSMDKPLASIVAGDWDREEAKAEFIREEQRSNIFRAIMTAQRSKKHGQVIEMLDENRELFAGSKYESYLNTFRFQAALGSQDVKAILKEIQANVEADDSLSAVNTWAWAVYEAVAEGYPGDAEIVSATIDALKNAMADSTDESLWAALDTLAHLQAHTGDHQAAIESQTRAVKLAPKGQAESLQAYLDELNKESAKAAEPESNDE
jgi:thiol-disulfide isomerase/thioredoxin